MYLPKTLLSLLILSLFSACGTNDSPKPGPVKPTYSVTYDANGADSGVVPDTGSYTEGAAVTVPANPGNLFKENYSLTDWTDQDAETPATYAPGDTFDMGTEDITLYAVWSPRTWKQVGTAKFTAGYANKVSLALDNGMPYVAYQDGANSNRASVMKYNGTAWVQVGTAGFSAGTSSYTSLAFDNGMSYVAYRDAANSNRASVMKYNGTTWLLVGTGGFSAGIAESISLAFYNRTPYVAYQDGLASKASVMKYE